MVKVTPQFLRFTSWMLFNNSPSGKSVGPDGFGCDFYKAFHGNIVPLMLRMVNDSVKNKGLPSSIYEDNICLLLKAGKVETDPARPITLLNCEQKLITKVLATKLVSISQQMYI